MFEAQDRDDATDDLGRRVLEAQEHFELVLLGGQRWTCHLLAWGRDALLVQTTAGRYLVPQHAIAYIALDEASGEELGQATAAVELAEVGAPPAPDVFTADAEHPGPPVP